MRNADRLVEIVEQEVHRAFRFGMRSLTFEDARQEVCADVLRLMAIKNKPLDGNWGLVRVIARSQLARAQRFSGRRLRPVTAVLPGNRAVEDVDGDPEPCLAFDPVEEEETALAAFQAVSRWRSETGGGPLSGKNSRQAEAQALRRAAVWLVRNRRPFDEFVAEESINA